MRAAVRIAVAAVSALALAGCVTPADFDDGGAIRTVNVTAAELTAPKTVYFATTRCNGKNGAGEPGTAEELFTKRCWEATLDNAEMARLGFGIAHSAAITCGTAAVTVAGFDGDEGALTAVDVPVSYACADGYEKLRQAVLATQCRCALIFVHGYNTTFGFGIKRTAQLAVDLGYEGVPIMFSFGAAGRFNDYVNDVESAELSTPALRHLLVALSRGDGDDRPKLDVIAHSMGARLTLRAISEGDVQPSVRHVVLAAPDIDPAYFIQLAGKGSPHTERLTVYTAKHDVAMTASAAAHNGRARLGEGIAASAAQDLPNTDLIDATERATDPYAHSYFAESKVVLNDIRSALRGVPASQRNPLICEQKSSLAACRMRCPEGAKCGPTWYARLIHWLFD